MQELARAIINHTNSKTFLLELLNLTAPRFFYETLCALSNNGKKDPEGVKEEIKKVLETYLETHSRLKPSNRDFLSDEETIRATLIYLLNTYHLKNKERFPAIVVATWIALERKEQDFKNFWNDIDKEGNIRLDQALLAYWVYGG